jgi:hypothetical protein
MPAPKGNKHASKGEKRLGTQVTIRLNNRQLAKLDRLASELGIKRSAALRRLVEELS